jgi:hypothetical protein
MFSGPRFLVTVALELLLMSAWGMGASAVGYSTPLQPGNSALYEVSGNYSENVTTTEMVVVTINGPNVTASFKDRYLDLSESTSGFWIDVASGQRNSSNFIFAIGAELRPRDLIPNGSDPPITVQIEQTRACGSAQRLTNYATYQVAIVIGTRTVQAYWDRTSGVACAFSFRDPGGELSLNMTSTSLWAPDAPASPGDGRLNLVPWLLLAIVAIPLVLLLVFRVGKRTKGHVRG